MKPGERRSRGFTIIELMIAMIILSFIALAVYQNTSQSFVLRDKLERDGDFYNSIRVALDLFARDVAHIYTPQAAALPGDIGKASAPPDPNKPPAQSPDPAAAQNYNFTLNMTTLPLWGEPVNPSGVRPSRFNGEATRVSFLTNSHMRLFRDTPESDFAGISYALEEDKLSEQPGAKALVKREGTEIFSEREDPEAEVRYTLLTNVRNLKFQYLDGEKDTWSDKWDTTGMDHKDVFPSIVEITLEVFVPGTEGTFTITQRYRPEMQL